VIFFTPPKEIENSLICLNEHSESIRNDQSSQSIKINIHKNKLNIKETPNSLNTNFIHNPNTGSCNLNNNLASTNTNVQKYPIRNCNVPINNCNFQNKSKNLNVPKIKNSENPKSKFFKTENTTQFPMISNSISTDELMTKINSSEEKNVIVSIDNDRSNELETSKFSIDYEKNDARQQSKNTSSSSKPHSDLILDNDNILSINFTNDSNLSKKVIDGKNYSKPTKLNMVTTEPYPKYTPTVEKAIKKYENKQPKKECIVM